MILFLIGLYGFLGVHLTRVIAPGFRERMIARLGSRFRWMGVYSVPAILFFVLMVIGYPDAQLSTIVFAEPPTPLKHMNSLFSPIALVLFFAGSLPYGYLQKILKHPQLVGVKLWSLGHLLANWDVTSFILFGSFMAWAVIVRIAAKKRPPAAPKTPSALWDGVSVLLGGAVTGWMIMGGHLALFGRAPIPGM
ncbi:MAG: NnrU family protein [Ponticaulis sp.]|nr:NnrU family protein [Ponticaulis sp.]